MSNDWLAFESDGVKAKDLIEQGKYVPCKICMEAFRRIRPSLRYCAICGHAFCEGEHGNFASGIGRCIICGASKDYRR